MFLSFLLVLFKIFLSSCHLDSVVFILVILKCAFVVFVFKDVSVKL